MVQYDFNKDYVGESKKRRRFVVNIDSCSIYIKYKHILQRFLNKYEKNNVTLLSSQNYCKSRKKLPEIVLI